VTRPRVVHALVTAALLLASIVHPLGAQAREPVDRRPAVAVMYFHNSSIFQHDAFEPLSTGITELLIHELSQNEAIRVVEREQLQKVLGELGLQQTDRIDHETAARIGQLVGAQHVILGAFIVDPRGRTMEITGRADQTETGVVARSEKVEGKPDDALKLVAQLGRQLSARIARLPLPARDAPGGRDEGGQGRFDAVLLYSRALVEQDRGNTLQAAALFNEALARYPAYAQARVALTRLARLPRSE
jgi:TolB-like protein